MRRLSFLVTTVLLLLLVADVCAEDRLHVSARAGGRFGAWEGTRKKDSLAMVEAHIFYKPGTVLIRATGTIDLHPKIAQLKNIGPEGIRGIPRARGMYTALEEAKVDKNGLDALEPVFDHAGALIGAFVPATVTDSSNFHPWNDEFGGSISSEMLFFIGRGPKYFTAPEPGTLF